MLNPIVAALECVGVKYGVLQVRYVYQIWLHNIPSNVHKYSKNYVALDLGPV
jgi:hypothetical protein